MTGAEYCCALVNQTFIAGEREEFSCKRDSWRLGCFNPVYQIAAAELTFELLEDTCLPSTPCN